MNKLITHQSTYILYNFQQLEAIQYIRYSLLILHNMHNQNSFISLRWCSWRLLSGGTGWQSCGPRWHVISGLLSCRMGALAFFTASRFRTGWRGYTESSPKPTDENSLVFYWCLARQAKNEVLQALVCGFHLFMYSLPLLVHSQLC